MPKPDKMNFYYTKGLTVDRVYQTIRASGHDMERQVIIPDAGNRFVRRIEVDNVNLILSIYAYAKP